LLLPVNTSTRAHMMTKLFFGYVFRTQPIAGLFTYINDAIGESNIISRINLKGEICDIELRFQD